MSSPRARAQLRKAKEQRLQALQIQAAQKGIDSPPQLLTEIDTLRAEIDLFDVAPVGDEVIEAVPGTTDQIMLGAVMKLTRDIGEFTGQMPGLRDLVQKAIGRMHVMEQDQGRNAEKHDQAHREVDTKMAQHAQNHREMDRNTKEDDKQLVEIGAGQKINRGITLVLLVLVVIVLFVLWRVFG